MKVNKRAPLYVKKEIVIDSSIDHVWNIQTDMENWPAWQKDISSVHVMGELKEGTVFKWKANGTSISSTLEEVQREKVIGWTGDAIGMHAVHYWYFEKQGSRTKVVTEESLTGWVPIILKLFKPNFLEESLQKALLLLKNYSEKSK